MAKQRIVNTHFWRDNYILSLKSHERLLFLWVITNPATELCGAYEVAISTIELETGLKAKQILESFVRFESDGKILYRDGWVVTRNFTKHQNGTSTNIKKGAERSLSNCPDWVKDTLSKGIGIDPNPTLPRPRPEPRPKPEPSDKNLSPLPPDFAISDSMRDWATAKVPNLDIDDELEEFCGFWWNIDNGKTKRSAAGWVQTWQGRMREVAKRSRPRTQPPPKARSGDLLSPDYQPDKPFVLTFEIGMEGEPPGMTWDRYEEIKQIHRERNPDRAEQEIRDYEHGYDFRQRFGEAGQNGNDPSVEHRRSESLGIEQAAMPVP